MKYAIMAAVVLGSMLGAAPSGRADAITFESGFADRMPLTAPIATATNSVRIGVSDGGAVRSPVIAKVGAPETAFTPDDRPANLAVSGDYFLSDEAGGPAGSARAYTFDFANPTANLALNVYDYRSSDGGATLGDTATLSAFGDEGRQNLVGSQTYTISTGALPNGAIELLSVANPTAPIRSAVLTFSRGDVGSGIDNITFAPAAVPEPGTLAVLGLGALGLIASRRRRVA